MQSHMSNLSIQAGVNNHRVDDYYIHVMSGIILYMRTVGVGPLYTKCTCSASQQLDRHLLLFSMCSWYVPQA